MKRRYNNVHWNMKSEEPYVLNLTSDFKPIQFGHIELKLDKFIFPGGEPHLRISGEPYPGTLIITHRANSGQHMIEILLANDAARRMGFKDIRLVVPCFPAARQDRVCNEGEPLTVKVFADLINGCGFNDVVILSPHSEVTPALLNNVVVMDELPYAKRIIDGFLEEYVGYMKITLKDPVFEINIICPDAGAGKRVGKIHKYLADQFPRIQFNLIECSKDRDVKTGNIRGFSVRADDLGGHYSIIFDDIVAKGGTFLGLADVLREKNCGDLAIFTSHADCLEGITNLLGKFDKVYTTNSKHYWEEFFHGEKGDKLTVFPFELCSL